MSPPILSVRPNTPPGEYWIAELKTGLAAGELLDDLRLVRFYRERPIATRAEVGWVVVLPEQEAIRNACNRSINKICSRLESEPGGCTVLTEHIESWLMASVVIPRTARGACHASEGGERFLRRDSGADYPAA